MIQRPEVIEDILKFPKLCEIFNTKKTQKPWETIELNLNDQKAITIPLAPVLQYFKNLKILKLNNNNISQFRAEKIVYGMPNILHIELRNNQIRTWDDLADLGKLKKLCILNFENNPVIGNKFHSIPHLSILKNIMFHEKYKKYNAVNVLCASYSVNTKAINITYDQQQKILAKERFINRFEGEGYDPQQKHHTKIITKVNKKLIKQTVLRCPVPRRDPWFKYLQVVNNKLITIKNILDLSDGNEISQLVVNWRIIKNQEKRKNIEKWNKQKEGKLFDVPLIYETVQLEGIHAVQKDKDIIEEKMKKKRLSKKKSTKVGIEKWAEQRKKAREHREKKEHPQKIKHKRDNHLHQKYLGRYQKRVQKELREFAPLLYLNKKDEAEDEGDKWHQYMQNLSQLDNLNHQRRKQFNQIKQKFGLDLWEKPGDEIAQKKLEKTKDQNFIRIKQYKKMCKDYEDKKKKKLQQQEDRRKEIEEQGQLQPKDNKFQSKKQLQQLQKAQKKRAQRLKGIPIIYITTHPTKEELDELENDPDIKRIFKKRKKPIQIKYKVQEDQNFGSSESDISEKENEDHDISTQFSEKDECSLINDDDDQVANFVSNLTLQEDNFMSPQKDSTNFFQSDSKTDQIQQEKEKTPEKIKQQSEIKAIKKDQLISTTIQAATNKIERKYRFIDEEKDKQRIISRQKRETAYKKYIEREREEERCKNRIAQINGKKDGKPIEIAHIIPEMQKEEIILSKKNLKPVVEETEIEVTKEIDEKKDNSNIQLSYKDPVFQVGNIMDYAKSLNQESLQEVEGKVKKVDNVKLDNFTYYGRFDKKKIKKMGDPGRRSGFQVQNKIFYKHHKSKRSLQKSQNNFYKSSTTTHIRPQTSNNTRKKVKKRRKKLRKIVKKPHEFLFDQKVESIKPLLGKYVYVPQKVEQKKKKILTKELYDQGPMFEKPDPEGIRFDDLLLKDKNAQNRKYDILRQKGEEYDTFINLLETIQETRQLTSDIHKTLPNTIDQRTRTIRSNQLHDYERIYNLVLEHSNRNGIKPNYYLGKDNKILREIIYKVNNYKDTIPPDMKPAILQKIIKETLQPTKASKLAEDYLEHVEDKQIQKKVIVKKTEQKELDQAIHNSILAAHFQRIKKYYSKEEMKKIQGNFNLDALDLGMDDEVTFPGTQGFMGRQGFRCNFRKYMTKPAIPKIRPHHTETFTEKINRLNIEKLHLPYGPPHLKEINIQGVYKDEIPNIDEILKANVKVWPRMETMEEMVENAMRKERQEFDKEGDKLLSKEERMIKFARDFEKNMNKRKMLKKDVQKYIKNAGKQLDQFWQDQVDEHDNNFDKEYCFLRLVRIIRKEFKEKYNK